MIKYALLIKTLTKMLLAFLAFVFILNAAKKAYRTTHGSYRFHATSIILFLSYISYKYIYIIHGSKLNGFYIAISFNMFVGIIIYNLYFEKYKLEFDNYIQYKKRYIAYSIISILTGTYFTIKCYINLEFKYLFLMSFSIFLSSLIYFMYKKYKLHFS